MESNIKKCPHCGKDIQAVAKKCRYCGSWLDEAMKPQQNFSMSQGSNSDTKRYLYRRILLGICALFVIVVFIALIVNTNTKPDDNASMNTKYSEIENAEGSNTIDEIEKRIAEYEATSTPEEKAQEPWRVHLAKIQGNYLIDRRSTGADTDMVHQYGKYVISGNTLTRYEWSESSNSWKPEFSSEFQLFKFQEDGYMTDYNLLYIDQYGNECRMCSGDTNGDGVMDLWQTDGFFWTKQ